MTAQTSRTREAMIDDLRSLEGRDRTRAAELAIVERYTDEDDEPEGEWYGLPAGDWMGIE